MMYYVQLVLCTTKDTKGSDDQNSKLVHFVFFVVKSSSL